MGIIKKIFSPLTKDTQEFVYQAKALVKHDKIARGQKVLAPKHPTDQANFKEAQKNEKIKQEVALRRDDLIQNVNKMTIKSFDPPERPKSDRPLPTRQSEFEHINSPKFEYGFYEPSLDKMQSGKLMLRETMELLHAKMEIDLEGPETENAKNVLQTHPATSRVTAEDIDDLYNYYRPFVRKDTQLVANKRDLMEISEYMNNRGDYDYNVKYLEMEGPMQQAKSLKRSLQQQYSVLEDDQKAEIIASINKRKIEERKRLEAQLQEGFAEPKEKDGKLEESSKK